MCPCFLGSCETANDMINRQALSLLFLAISLQFMHLENHNCIIGCLGQVMTREFLLRVHDG